VARVCVERPARSPRPPAVRVPPPPARCPCRRHPPRRPPRRPGVARVSKRGGKAEQRALDAYARLTRAADLLVARSERALLASAPGARRLSHAQLMLLATLRRAGPAAPARPGHEARAQQGQRHRAHRRAAARGARAPRAQRHRPPLRGRAPHAGRRRDGGRGVSGARGRGRGGDDGALERRAGAPRAAVPQAGQGAARAQTKAASAPALVAGAAGDGSPEPDAD
jgi:hypothetical protein